MRTRPQTELKKEIRLFFSDRCPVLPNGWADFRQTNYLKVYFQNGNGESKSSQDRAWWSLNMRVSGATHHGHHAYAF